MLPTEKKFHEPDFARLVSNLEQEEANRIRAYDDATGDNIDFSSVCKGVPTIGIGFNLSNFFTRERNRKICAMHAQELHSELYAYSWYRELSAARKECLLEIAFNVGMGGLFLFRKMIEAIKRQDWVEAGNQIVDSKAARRLAPRYNRIREKWLKG